MRWSDKQLQTYLRYFHRINVPPFRDWLERIQWPPEVISCHSFIWILPTMSYLCIGMLTGSHGCLVGISKPTMFTGASAMFLLIYLALWKYHDSTNPLLASASSLPGDESRLLPGAHSPRDFLEQVMSCDLDEPVWMLKNQFSLKFMIFYFSNSGKGKCDADKKWVNAHHLFCHTHICSVCTNGRIN